MKRSLLPGLIILLPIFVKSQSLQRNQIPVSSKAAAMLQGLVFSQNEAVSGATIKNSRTHEKIISDVRGMFAIKAVTGDTLFTNALNYKADTLMVKGQADLTINLQRTSTMLHDVVIKDTKLSPLDKFHKSQQDYHDIYRKGNMRDMVSISSGLMGNGLNAGPAAGVGLSIDAIYSALSKQGKDARRLQRRLVNDYKNDVVDSRFTKTLVSRITGLDGEKLSDFIFKYRPTYEFVMKSSDYDLMVYIKQKMVVEAKLK